MHTFRRSFGLVLCIVLTVFGTINISAHDFTRHLNVHTLVAVVCILMAIVVLTVLYVWDPRDHEKVWKTTADLVAASLMTVAVIYGLTWNNIASVAELVGGILVAGVLYMMTIVVDLKNPFNRPQPIAQQPAQPAP
jgi:uncharacterized BrkB/YihY/UPF0761 family membrane protein